MGATEKRMEQLGIELQRTDWRGKGAVEAVFAGDLLYLSAHYPVDETGKPVYVGRVGAEIDEKTAYEAARLCGLPGDGYDVLLFATSRTHDSSPEQVASSLRRLLKRAGL